ncbi:related to Peregrin (Bromodomain and PHD finger-containing protein 1) [Pseudozyma flocculosa]|uniref:Related to Peregrin (Bromodomain and PHD finger-containing protein 1) n=1 Tax=Pseudozyma flocculosa TaxID=84751 RepID=A0A5C3F1S2_9BASI|nr:related to Peregrin (Bromodomain and PHD finger-containing protein 1) [Pseudozyma flocculosa]
MPGLPTKPNNIPLASSLPKVSFRRIPAQEAIALAAPAGVVDQQNVDFGFNDGSPFERPEHYLRYVEPIETELKHQVEYDMDEQDQEWLDALNADRKRDQLDAVSNEVFEIIIDQLEKEWFDLMKQVPTKPPHGAQDDPGADDDDGEDTKCAICDDGEGENSNAIVFCDGCNLAVHQDCYGIPYVPEGQWLCRKCTVSPDRAVSCILCPHEGGAFKQTTQGKWAHLLCAMWIPETGVSNPVYMEPIDSVEKIPKARWRLQCYLCRCKMGACIQCDNKVCYAAFHVTCATKAGLLIQTERKRTSHHGGGGGGNGGGGDSGDDDSDSDAAPILRARCHKHVPPKLRSQLKISFDRANAISAYDDDLDGPAVRGSPFGHSSQRTREQSLDSSSAAPLIPVSRSGSVLADHDGQGSKSARAYKRSYRAGPPLVPAYIVNRVLDYIGRIALRKKPPLVAQIARFWSLKREARRGAPLLKRLHLEPWTASSHTKEQTDAQKVKKLAFLNTLRNDLEAVRMLAELVRKREREKLRQARLLRDALVNATLFPYYDVLASALAKVEALDRAHFFAAPVSRTEVPDYYDIIREPMDWSTMRDRLHEKAYASVQQFRDDVGRVLANAMTYNKADTPFHKAASRIQRQLPHAFRDLEHIEQLHQASFQAACRKLRPKRGDPADADRDVVLDDDTRDALQQLRLEPPIDHVMLLRDYAGMASRELHEVRGPEDKVSAFFSGVLQDAAAGPGAAVAAAAAAAAATSTTAADEGSSASPSRPAPNAAVQPGNVVEDLARQFYRPRLPQAQARRIMGRTSLGAGVSTPNTRSRRQSSEVSTEPPPAPSTADRRASKRLKGDPTEATPAALAQPTEATPRSARKARPARIGTTRAVRSTAATAAAAGAGDDATMLEEPSVPPIPENAEAEQQAEQGEGETLPMSKAEATDATMTAAATPKASRARASRSAVATQRSSRATRARPARKTTEDKVDSGDEHDQGKRPSDAVAASGAHEDEGAGGKPKRPKRGHIPGEPEEIVTEEVDAIDSFLRFNTGWILKEGAKRNRGPRTPTSSSSAAVAEEPPLKRPRKASAPSANTSQASAASAAGTAAATASPQRPRAKTHPTRLAGASARLLDSGDGRKKADPDEAPVESEQTGATEGEVEATVGEDDVASTEATEATAADAADAGPTNGKPSDEERPRATPSRTPLGDADGEATTADTSGRSSPLSSEGEDEGDEAASPSPDKATGRALRSAPQQCHAVDGPVHSSTEAEGAAATADDAADLGDGDDDDEEGGVTPRRALKSRKSRVKAPPSSAPRKSARKPRRRSAAADDGDGAMPNEDPLCVPHTLVWAKMEGFPYFPAEVVDEDDEDQEIPDRVLEEKARQEALLLGPSAAASVSSSSSSSSKAASPADAASGSSAMRRQASSTSSSSVSASATATKAGSPDDAAEAASAGNNGQGGATAAASETKLVLVQFFGAKVREYVWLPTTKLRMMFEDAGVDDELLAVKEKKYAKHRRKVREAFQLAKAQLDA